MTTKRNQRRCDLIDKQIDKTITYREEAELQVLQQELYDYQKKNFPLPTEEMEALANELKWKIIRQYMHKAIDEAIDDELSNDE